MFIKFRFYFLVIFLFLNNFSCLKPMQNGPGGFRFNMFGEQFDINPAKAVDEFAQTMHQIARDAAERRAEEERKKQSKIKEIETRINALFAENRRFTIPENEFKARLKSLEKERDTLKNEIEKDKNSAREWEDGGRKLLFNVLSQGFDHIYANANQARKERETILKAAAKGKETNKGKMERLQEFFKPRNLAVGGGVVVLATAAIINSYYGANLVFNYLNAKLGKPNLIRESSRHDWKFALRKFFKETILGIEPEKNSLEEVILQPTMAKKLKMLADDTKSCAQNGLPFRNILFYGPPGTGKTMFAKRLAKYSDMDYAIMSGADFAQFKNGEGITELHKVFDWANLSKKGLIIFVDEADSALGNRKTLDDIGRKIVNAFLSQTGESSFKFMLILATNYADDLDSAVLSRIHKKVCFDLPAYPERLKIFNLYFDKYIVNDERKFEIDGAVQERMIEILPEINREYIENITKKIDGFSGREIEQMVSELRVVAYNIGNGKLTRDICDDVVDEKIKEHIHAANIVAKQRGKN
ncbi:AAA family ATPase [Candidatus Dependentiae bacterium]|nr:AAA family ATPase [Candidatus Dependentiae bacterium]